MWHGTTPPAPEVAVAGATMMRVGAEQRYGMMAGLSTLAETRAFRYSMVIIYIY